ncbi:MAG TPA: hypothetical protein VFA66_01935 [Gaiellaceae bacterium]|nr:hypothetical protein [Gaiellaceae bacterium]
MLVIVAGGAGFLVGGAWVAATAAVLTQIATRLRRFARTRP